MMKSKRYLLPILLISLAACSQQQDVSDAYGNFEAIEVMVSAESQGRIVAFVPEEGATLRKDQVTVVIDTTQLYLKKIQLESGFSSLVTRIQTLDAQVRASRVQMNNLEREKQRIDKLAEGGAATIKQQDDMNGQIALLEAQILATESQKSSVYAERKTLEVQIRQVEDQIMKCSIRNPIYGILLTKYKEAGEMAAPGQPLYKVANLDELILRAYVSGNQLSSVAVGKEVRVRFDVQEGMEECTGVVNWVSPRAEFTPKIIQTREERVNLVYALKIKVSNTGSLKIGMPGEVVF
ncbi:MAG: HlyD family efflux transporter periplasmic adaptor subunit [Bacteroidia bacterium]|nr:MAG: HlyD family efflux transporter periplasmic adaptor subunit [Bacteroidia bacterium]